MNRLRGDLMLLTAALIWGTAFVAQKAGNGVIGPLGFVAGRFVLSALLLLPFALREARVTPEPAKRQDWLLAVAVGLCLASGSIIQQVGLTTTSVTNAGFITALYIAFVPFVAWAIVRTKVRPLVLAACAVSLFGAWLLANHGEAARLQLGDLLILTGAVIFAAHIVTVSIFMRRAHRPFLLSFMQNAVTAVVAWIAVGLFEPVTSASLKAAFPTISYAGLVSVGIGYTLQIVGQRHTPATEAALIMSLESVFAAVAAAILLGERVPFLGTVGAVLIMLGVVMVELLPVLPWLGARPEPGEPILGEVPMD